MPSSCASTSKFPHHSFRPNDKFFTGMFASNSPSKVGPTRSLERFMILVEASTFAATPRRLIKRKCLGGETFSEANLDRDLPEACPSELAVPPAFAFMSSVLLIPQCYRSPRSIIVFIKPIITPRVFHCSCCRIDFILSQIHSPMSSNTSELSLTTDSTRSLGKTWISNLTTDRRPKSL